MQLCASCHPTLTSGNLPSYLQSSSKGRQWTFHLVCFVFREHHCASPLLHLEWIPSACYRLPRITESAGKSRLNEEKYYNAGDSRLCSRTKQLHYSLGAWKEKLKDLWCLSSVPGSCCSQRDLTPLWHLRARGKFLLSARGSSGRLTFMSLGGQHQKAVSAALKDGGGGRNRRRGDQGSLGMLSVQMTPVYIPVIYVSLYWCSPRKRGLYPPLVCTESGLRHFYRTPLPILLCDTATSCTDSQSSGFPSAKQWWYFLSPLA